MDRPKLLNHVYVRFQPSKKSDENALVFTTERRQIRLKGRGLKEFYEEIIPLLNGENTMVEIQSKTSHLFSHAEIAESLNLLGDYRFLEDSAQSELDFEPRSVLAPQLNFFWELTLPPDEIQRRLANAQITLFGVGGAGAAAALSLAAARVGAIRCVDSTLVRDADLLLSPVFRSADVGKPRAEVIAAAIRTVAPQVKAICVNNHVETDEDVAQAIDGTDFVICCADAGLRSIFYKINRVCLRANIPWTSCSGSAFEGTIGPTVHPNQTACYMCYQMRATACNAHPDDAVAFEAFLDARKRDDADNRENLSFNAGVLGNLVALEAFKVVSGIAPPGTLGRIMTVKFLELKFEKSVVLKKPWCPACSPLKSEETQSTGSILE